ncbi:hypothetical protein M9Y10_028174 [Tritrichomonas musculus]|uniref:Uncharacterized protein n=1 Tax=Tritrichomonas musculus TaxID=1915356 RepID=A0ABR2KJI7_9EUKA
MSRPESRASEKNLEDMTVKELRAELKKSNRQRSFERSRMINDMINNKIANDYESTIQPIIDDLGHKLDSLFQELKNITNEKDGELNQNEYILRESIEDSFSEMRQRQLLEMTELEVEKKSELIREKKRSPSSVQQLISLSIKLADRQEFDKAIDADHEAELLQQKEAEERLYQIELKYKKLTDSLLQKFTLELNGLQGKLDSGLNMIQKQYQQQILNVQKSIEINVKSSLLNAINAANNQVNKKEKQTEITQRLNNFVIQKAMENGMTKNLTFEQQQ